MIRNYLKEIIKVLPVFIPFAQVEATGGSARSSTAVEIADSDDVFQNGLAVFSLGQETGSPSSVAISLKLQDAPAGTTDYADLDPPVEVSISTLPGASGAVHKLAFSPAAMRPKRRWLLDIDFTGGSSPTIPLCLTEFLSGSHRDPVS